MGWQTERYEDAHEGFAGAALPDGQSRGPNTSTWGPAAICPRRKAYDADSGRLTVCPESPAWRRRPVWSRPASSQPPTRRRAALLAAALRSL